VDMRVSSMRENQLSIYASARAFWRHRWVGTAVAGLALSISAHDAFAQSSLGAPINAATASSLNDAVRQNEKQLIDREVLGARGGGTAGGSASGLSAFSTGRLRGGDHEALRAVNGAPDSSNGPYPYDTQEYSTFGNVVVAIPGTVWGGQLKLSGFVGHNVVSLDLKSDSVHVLDPDQSGSAFNHSLIAGGTVLWSLANTYALATLVGSVGQSTLKDAVDDCHGSFCHHNRYNFDTTGVIATVTAGQVFELAGKSGPKLDVRGSLGYTHNVGDTFTNVFADQQKYTFSSWTGSGTATLFTNMTLSDGALLRPYIAGYIRREWGYRNKLEATQSDGLFLGEFFYEQKHLYGGIDAGLTYAQGDTTFGASLYYEGSGDEHTLGGRLGISQKLDGAVAAAQGRSFSWSGFYAGLNAGHTWATSNIGTSVECLDIGDGLNPPDGNFTCPFTTAAEVAGSTTAAQINAAGTGKLSDHSFIGGGQAGYNLQVGGIVVGLEIDGASFNLGAARSTSALGTTVTTAFDTDWLFTARTRLGVPVAPSLLLYGTGGFALTNLGVTNSVTSIGAASTHGLVTGWTVGGGMEWALSRNWILRGEYLFLDFGKVSVNTPTAISGAQLSSDYNTARSTADLTAHMLRVGLNYKF
jgi:outer membrane immunogenic protein